jgi:hypothetical protein
LEARAEEGRPGIMRRPHRWRCDDCYRSFDDVEPAPMLHDVVWLRFAHKREALCADCMFDRAGKADVRITIADLRLCPMNYGWFTALLGLPA